MKKKVHQKEPDQEDQGCRHISSHMHFPVQQVPEEVGLRYNYSNYVIDPNKFRFRKVVRVYGLVILFLNKLCQKVNRHPKFMINDDS